MPRVNTEDVKNRIREGILKLAAEDGKDFTYSPSTLSKVANVSRPTLYKYADYIDEVLNGVKARRKLAKGMGVIEFMRERTDRTEDEKKALVAELKVMRKHHIDLYQKLYYESASLAAVIKPVLLKESVDLGKCILCSEAVNASILKKNNVVNISTYRGDKETIPPKKIIPNRDSLTKTLILTVGLPRSGKSTWALQQGLPVVNPDAIRKTLHNQRFFKNAESTVWAIAKAMVTALFESGHSQVILDATNTTRKSREGWVDKRWQRRFIEFDATPDICIQRARELDDKSIISVIKEKAAKFEPLGEEYWPWEADAKK